MSKFVIILLKKSEVLSSVACRLTLWTGKSKYPIHPKHLIKKSKWYVKYLKKRDVILDLGCGVGQSCLEISGLVKKVIGLDISSGNIEIGRKSAIDRKIKNLDFIIHDANEKLPFKDKVFEKVICSDVLEHLKKRNYALKEMLRVLKLNGLLLLVTDNPETTWKKHQREAGLFYYADREHNYEYSKDEILKVLKMNKLKLISLKTVTYDTPLKGFIDLTGGISLGIYKKIQKWKSKMVKKFPSETTGYRIVAQKIK